MMRRLLLFCSISVVSCLAACNSKQPTDCAIDQRQQQSAVNVSQEHNPLGSSFQDDPAAHALYDQMIEVLRKADTLSYTSQYRWEAIGKEQGECTYRAWLKKPNYFRIETEIPPKEPDGIIKKGGILIGDGNALWIHWPQGRPKLWIADHETYEKTRLNSFMTKLTPQARHSIGDEFRLLAMTDRLVINPSTFHGYTDCFQKHIDGVKSLGTARVGVARTAIRSKSAS